MKRALLIAMTALAFVALAAGLFSGGDWLGLETWVFGIPVGNFVAWGLVVAWCALAWLSWSNSGMRRIALGILVLAAVWLPVSIALFGNVDLNNPVPAAYNAWLAYTGLLTVTPPLLMLAAAVQWAWNALRRR